MPDLDPAFIDVDFRVQPQFVFGDKGARCFSDLASYADVEPTIPEERWPELAEKAKANGGGLSQLVSRIYDQKNEGSCVANACSQAHEIIQATQYGKENVVHLSAISLYKRIGSSPQSGAMVSDGLEEMAQRGILPLDTPENRAKYGSGVMPNTGWGNRFPANCEETASKFRGHEWLVVRSTAALITALFRGHPVVVGRQGHSICYCDPVYEDGRLLVKYANSWSEGWGQSGFGYDSMNLIRQSASWAFALRSVVVEMP